MKTETATKVIEVLKEFGVNSHQLPHNGTVFVNRQDAVEVVGADGFVDLMDLVKGSCGNGFHFVKGDKEHLGIESVY